MRGDGPGRPRPDDLAWPPPADDEVEIVDLERGEDDPLPGGFLEGTAVFQGSRTVEGSEVEQAERDEPRDLEQAKVDEPRDQGVPTLDGGEGDEHANDIGSPLVPPVASQRGRGDAGSQDGRGDRPRPGTLFGNLAPRLPLERIALVILAALVLLEGVFLLRGRFERAGSGAAAAGIARPSPGTVAERAEARGPGASSPVGSSGAGGQLTVTTEPAGAEVTVDGRSRGKAPLTVEDLGPGEHEVVIRSAQGSLRQRVRVTAGETTALVVPLAAPAPPSRPPAPREGTLTVRAPIEVRVFDGDRLVGTSAMERLRLDRGSHRLVFRNEDIGFEQSRTVSIAAGRVTTLSLDLPPQQVALNATPWAEVFVDGKPVGETPIGALRVPIGPHTIAFRHPQLGEKSMRVVVKANEPVRLSVDMRK